MAYASEPSTDPSIASVVMMMHMDGADGANSFPEFRGKTATLVGTPTTSQTWKKNGTASARFNGADQITLPASTDWLFPGDFTIEGSFNPDSVTGNKVILSNYSSGATGDWMLRMQGATPIFYIDGAGSWAGNAGTVVAGVNNDFALVRSGTTCTFYLNGQAVGVTFTKSGNFGVSTSALSIGSRLSGTMDYFTGYVDELRITKGVARYLGNYTPRRSAFPEI
jgi:hypothetical protein